MAHLIAHQAVLAGAEPDNVDVAALLPRWAATELPEFTPDAAAAVLAGGPPVKR